MATVPMWFLSELELYNTVKPYRLDFDPENDAIPRTNVVRIQVPNVPVHDIRSAEEELQFSKCGFSILNMPIALTKLDYDNHKLVKDQYYPFLERSLQEFNEKTNKGAKVLALDHKVRKRDALFPISSGKNYVDPQPVLVAHVDWTPETIEKKLRIVAGNEQTNSILEAKEYQFCHAWRPIIGPLTDFPLAVCDYSTINPDSDLEPADDVTENHGVDENYLVYHKPNHKWYYISDQRPTEILLFRQYDTTIGRRSGVPHCAIPNPIPPESVIPRQSIEVELIVWWE